MRSARRRPRAERTVHLAPASQLALINSMSHRLLLLLGLAGLLFAGCTKEKPATAAAGPAPRKVLRFGNGAEPQDLDPHIVTGTPEYRLLQTFARAW